MVRMKLRERNETENHHVECEEFFTIGLKFLSKTVKKIENFDQSKYVKNTMCHLATK